MTREIGGRRRAQAAIIGIVLLVGLVAVGGIGILLIGEQINDESRQRAENTRIEQGFLQLGQDIDSVSRTDSGVRVTDLDLPNRGGSAVREAATGRIWVNRTNFTTRTTDVLVNRSVGSIRYDTDDGTTFVYQSGAVFRGTGEGVVVLSNPSFQYALDRDGGNPTLTLPIVTTVGPDTIPNGAVRTRKVSTETPLNDDIIVENDLISVTVRSDYYRGWAQYFREIAATSGSTEAAVTVDDARRTATLELIVPVNRPSVEAGIVGSASGGTFRFDNNIAIDSYDSDEGDYASSGGGNARVVVAGNLTLANNQEIDGDVAVGERLTLENSATVTGNASYGSVDPDPPGSQVGGWANDNATVVGYEPVDTLIDARGVQIRDENDNDEVDVVSGESIDASCSSCTFEEGNYYLEDFQQGGTAITFDPDGGEINVVVNGTVDLDGDIDVVGSDGRVNVWVDSEQSGTDDIQYDGAELSIPGDESDRFWLYVDRDASASFRGNGQFRGVVFGPGGDTGGVDVEIRNNGEYYGGFVGQVDDIDNNIALHFDEALQDTETVTATTSVPRLTYLVVTSHTVEVESD